MGAISARLRDLIQEAKIQKTIDIATLHAAQEKTMRELENIAMSGEMGPGIDPAHAAYASAQNFFAVLADNISMLPLFDEYARKTERAMDTYEPGYPPMSPVTNTFFSFWAHFDLGFGIDNETMGGCILDAAGVLGLEDDIVQFFIRFESSRMGIFVNRGVDEHGRVGLEEIFTGKRFACRCGSGYTGRESEIWFVRIVPSPISIGDYYVIITTPYIVTGTNADDWSAYFERVVPRIGIFPQLLAYGELMKHGIVPDYWNEYVFQAYSNYRNDAVFLHGIPDKPESLPHFDPESTIGFDLSKVRSENERRTMRKKAAKKLKRK